MVPGKKTTKKPKPEANKIPKTILWPYFWAPLHFTKTILCLESALKYFDRIAWKCNADSLFQIRICWCNVANPVISHPLRVKVYCLQLY